jgi:hypothetical protein
LLKEARTYEHVVGVPKNPQHAAQLYC